MKLPVKVATLEGIDEKFHALYVKQGEHFILSITGVDDHPDVAGLKANKEELLGEKKGLETQIAAWLALGKKPEEIAELVKNVESSQQAKLIAEGKIDEVLAQKEEQHRLAIEQLTGNFGNEKKAWEGEKTALFSNVDRLVRVNAIDTALQAEGGKPSLLKDKLMNLTETVAVKKADGSVEYEVRVKDEKNPTVHRYFGSDGVFMSPLQYVQELKKDVDNYGGAFTASAPGGSGAPSQQNNNTRTGGGASSTAAPTTGVSLISAGLQERAK